MTAPPNADALRLVIAQQDFLVGAPGENADKVIRALDEARERHRARVVVFPELTLVGYPPEDLLFRTTLHDRVQAALERILPHTRGLAALVGLPERDADGRLYNACAVLEDGALKACCRKQRLPNYGVFDEQRYFRPGREPCVVELAGVPCGITLCEDIWAPEPAARAAAAGARLLVNLNASPYHLGKGHERMEVVAARARETGLGVVYANLVGGQDELVFDGHSFVCDPDGQVRHEAPPFAEGLFPVDLDRSDRLRVVAPVRPAPLGPEESVYQALVTGVRDYVDKNGFPGAVVGLSGGIDSALTLAVAVDALGAGRVEAVLMPSRYTAAMSLEDARAEAEALGVVHHQVPIEGPFQAFLDALAEPFAGTEPDTTEENIQARCRGIILMALSNKTGKMVLTTGNKSEMAVGYATLYGDMAGGFAPLKDLPKMLVYRLARWRNGRSAVIPQRVIERPPSAELAPDQTDQDSLPPYPALDAILELFVEQDRDRDAIVAAGHDPADVDRVIRLVLRNEYKRRQAAPGVKITPRAFGKDRRYPITSGYT